jgi:hypothetical protein
MEPMQAATRATSVTRCWRFLTAAPCSCSARKARSISRNLKITIPAGAGAGSTGRSRQGPLHSVDSTVPIDWQKDDHIVVTTTDYLANHSEELVIEAISGDEITFHTVCSADATCASKGVQWTHNGAKYSLAEADHKGISRLKLNRTSAETRAAVALLTRSIRIVSEGDEAMKPFPPAQTGYYFGGHTVARQGFKVFQMQGVEFHQLGQGGRLGPLPGPFPHGAASPPFRHPRASGHLRQRLFGQ